MAVPAPLPRRKKCPIQQVPAAPTALPRARLSPARQPEGATAAVTIPLAIVGAAPGRGAAPRGARATTGATAAAAAAASQAHRERFHMFEHGRGCRLSGSDTGGGDRSPLPKPRRPPPPAPPPVASLPLWSTATTAVAMTIEGSPETLGSVRAEGTPKQKRDFKKYMCCTTYYGVDLDARRCGVAPAAKLIHFPALGNSL